MILMCNAIIIIMRAATPVAVMAAMKEVIPAEDIAAEDTKTLKHIFFIYAFLFCFLIYCGTILLRVQE